MEHSTAVCEGGVETALMVLCLPHGERHRVKLLTVETFQFQIHAQQLERVITYAIGFGRLELNFLVVLIRDL